MLSALKVGRERSSLESPILLQKYIFLLFPQTTLSPGRKSLVIRREACIRWTPGPRAALDARDGEEAFNAPVAFSNQSAVWP